MHTFISVYRCCPANEHPIWAKQHARSFLHMMLSVAFHCTRMNTSALQRLMSCSQPTSNPMANAPLFCSSATLCLKYTRLLLASGPLHFPCPWISPPTCLPRAHPFVSFRSKIKCHLLGHVFLGHHHRSSLPARYSSFHRPAPLSSSYSQT